MTEELNLAESTIALRLDDAEQREIVDEVMAVCAASPPVRFKAKGGMDMSVRVTSAGVLGWTADATGYQYVDHDSKGRPWPDIPKRWLAIADKVAGARGWDSAIVNWYDVDANLGWHRDVSERDRRLPIVTISLGDDASWAVRASQYEKVHRCRLVSGDVTLLAGPSRLWMHTIERIIPAPLLSPLRGPGRVSITLRVAG